MVVGDKVWIYSRGGKPLGPVEVCRENKSGWVQVLHSESNVTSERIGVVCETEKEAWGRHLDYLNQRARALSRAIKNVESIIRDID